MELGVFVVIAAAAAGAVFVLALALGAPFHLRASLAAAIALVAVVFWFPALANVHIALAGGGRESRRARVCAAVRAFGLLVCSAAVGTAFLFAGLGPRVVVPSLLAGAALNFGTLFFDR